MPPRFYCDALPAPGLPEPAADAAASGAARPEATCTLGPDETRHARKVLRLSAGDAVEVFDGRGRLAEATLVEFVRERGEDRALCRLGEVRQVPAATPRLTVATAVPKGPRAEAMVNQLGQLGADVFVPVRSARSVVEPGKGKGERYEKAAWASAKQSGRPWVMAVEPTEALAEVVDRPCDVGLILDPRGAAIPSLGERLQRAESVTVLIGPEGGWTDAEFADAEAAGFVRWRLADQVLRIETAATAAVSVVRYLAAPN